MSTQSQVNASIVNQTNQLINDLSRLADRIDPDYSDELLETVMTTVNPPQTPTQQIVWHLQALGFILNASGLADRDEARVVRFVDYHNA